MQRWVLPACVHRVPPMPRPTLCSCIRVLSRAEERKVKEGFGGHGMSVQHATVQA